jgi:hypothetical protein
MSVYNDLYSRDNFGDSGAVPSPGNPSMSPDIIPLQGGTLSWPQVQTSYNGPDIGLPIKNGSPNNIYVRAKNLNLSAAGAGTVTLFYSKASVFLIPPWTPITAAGGQGRLNLIDSTGNTSIGSQALAINNPSFLLTGLPPISNDHYCLISVINTAAHPITIPSSFPSNAAFAQWVQNTPAVAWRNISRVPNGQTQVVRTFVFGNANPTGAYFYFSFTGRGYVTGTGISLQCTDAANPIQWSGTLPAPDPNGNQITGFQNWVIGGPNGFSSTAVVTVTSPSGAFPPGATLAFRYYQVPATMDALHRSAGRFVQVAQVHKKLGAQTFTAFLIPVGECNLVVASS